jgi:hypothetical protein
MSNIIDYKHLYLKYKTKYLNLKGGVGTTSKSTSKQVSNTTTSSEISALFNDIKLVAEGADVKKFFKKYGKKIDRYYNELFANTTPLQYYINLGGVNTNVIDFLLPSNHEKLFNIDESGQTLFHRLIINNNADIFEYLYFITFSENTETNINIRNQIINVRNTNTYKLNELISHINGAGSHNDVLRVITSITSSASDYENLRLSYLQRVHQKLLEQESGLLCSGKSKKQVIGPDDICATNIIPKPLGKRKIFDNTTKNNDLLQKRMRHDTTDKYTYCYKFEKIDLFVKSGHIHFIDNLYILKNESSDIIGLTSQIPPDWNIGNIRIITNTTLSDPSITFIAELTYDYMNQEDSDN